MYIIDIKKLKKDITNGTLCTNILHDISFKILSGVFYSITGPSGSGKSTLLNMLGLLDHPTSGSFLLDGKSVTHLSALEAARYRNQYLGFVFQSFQLISRLSAWENVSLPLLYRKLPRPERKEMAYTALRQVGLETRMEALPSQFSGGQQQRIAIARALIGTPKILLADEPTGSLDSNTSAEIFGLLRALNQNLGVTILMVTHDRALADKCDRRIDLLDGTVISDRSLTSVS